MAAVVSSGTFEITHIEVGSGALKAGVGTIEVRKVRTGTPEVQPGSAAALGTGVGVTAASTADTTELGADVVSVADDVGAAGARGRRADMPGVRCDDDAGVAAGADGTTDAVQCVRAGVCEDDQEACTK